MKILDTVTGSNQRLTQAQTVEKKAGAPMIWLQRGRRSVDTQRNGGRAIRGRKRRAKTKGGPHEYPVQGLGVVRGGQLASGLHVSLEVPELLEADAADVDDVGGQGDRGARVLAVDQLGAQGLGEAGEVLVEGEEADQLGRGVHRRGRGGGLGVGLVDGLLVGRDGL